MPEWAGTVPGWITASTLVTMLGLWFRYLTVRRQQDGARLTDLETENRQLRKDFDEYREKCVEETDNLHGLVNGLRAQIQQLQLRGIADVIELPKATREKFQPDPEMDAMIDKLKDEK